MTPWFFRVAAALPVLGYVAAIGLAEARVHRTPSYELAIEGYDPRDLVRGHYLMFRYAVEALGGGDARNRSACLVGSPGGRARMFIYDRGGPDPGCAAALGLSDAEGVHRVFVQQDRAAHWGAAVLDGRGSVRVRLLRGGALKVEQLLIDGVPAR